MTPAETLAAEYYGGAVDIETAEDPLGILFRAVMPLLRAPVDEATRFCAGAGRPFTFDLALGEGSDFDAGAAIVDGQGAIVINWGALVRVRGLVAQLIADPQTFASELGDAERPPGTPGVTAEDLVAGPLPYVRYWQPQSAAGILGLHLSEIAEVFIILHEIAHIGNGHLDWLQRRFGLKVYSETHAAPTPELTWEDLQTLEFDADATAVQHLLARYTAATPRVVRGRNLIAIPQTCALGSRNEALKIITFALYLVARFFNPEPPADTIEEDLNSDHPPGQFRVGAMLLQMEAVLTRSAGLTLGDFGEALAAGVWEAERAWHRAFGTPILNLFEEPYLTRRNELVRRYRDTWRRIQPELQPYARLGRIAPADDEAT